MARERLSMAARAVTNCALQSIMTAIARKHVWLSLIVLAAGILAGFQAAEAPPKLEEPDFGQLGTATMELDGNDITLLLGDGQRIANARLAGLQADSEHAARRATSLRRIAVGERLWFKRAGESPQNEVYRLWRQPDGLDVNLEVVREGADKAGTAGLSADEAKAFSEYEKRADSRDVGLWRQVAPQPATTAPPRITPPNQIKPEEKSGETVCVTKSGTKYHRCNCTHASKSGSPTTLEAAKARGLTPCSKCKPPV